MVGIRDIVGTNGNFEYRNTGPLIGLDILMTSLARTEQASLQCCVQYLGDTGHLPAYCKCQYR
jgi:hypothetical protein